MKNILFLALAGLIATSAEAQYNSSVSGPRYGQAVNQDNTGRAVTYGQLFKTDVAGSTLDTVTTALYMPSGTAANGFANITGTVFDATLYLTVKDSCVLAFNSAAYSLPGDQLTLVISNTQSFSPVVYLYGYSGLASQWQTVASGTKITCNAGKNAVLKFQYDGTYWEEVSRSIH